MTTMEIFRFAVFVGFGAVIGYLCGKIYDSWENSNSMIAIAIFLVFLRLIIGEVWTK